MGRRRTRAALGALAVATVGTVLSGITALPVLFVGGFDVARTVPGFTALFVASYVGYALTGVGYLRYRGHGWRFLDLRLPTFRDLGYVVGGTVGLFVALVVLGLLVRSLGLPTAGHNLFEPGFDPALLLALVPLVLFVNAPVEEFLFRGVIQKDLYRVFSRRNANILTSAVFAVVHLPAYYAPNLAATAVSLVVVFVGSYVFGWVYARTDNLLVPTAVHGAFNAIQIALFYLVLTEGETALVAL